MRKSILACIAVILSFSLGPRSGSGAGLTSEVRLLNGLPALYVNDVLTSQVLASPYRPGPSDFNDFRKAGISIFDILKLEATEKR